MSKGEDLLKMYLPFAKRPSRALVIFLNLHGKTRHYRNIYFRMDFERRTKGQGSWVGLALAQ